MFDTNRNNSLPTRVDSAPKSFRLSFGYLFKLLYLVLREMLFLFVRRARPYYQHYWQETRFTLRRLQLPWGKIAIGAACVLLLLRSGSFGFHFKTPFGRQTQYASIEEYTTALVAEGSAIDNTASNKNGATSNSLAPATTAELRDADNRLYIQAYAATAVAEMHRTQIPASISMAQAIVESRAGKGRLAQAVHNHFGIKCFSRSCKRGHCQNFEDDSHKDFFRAFAAPTDSWRAHSTFLQGARYQNLFTYGKDYKKWAQGLQQKGYATADNYSKTLISIIDKYQLYNLDYQ